MTTIINIPIHQYTNKLIHHIKKADWRGYAAVLLLCFIAVWPLLSRPSLPIETDAELHIYRLAELSRLVRAGEFYPRWSPNFYFGYGYPIFNYYAPLAYYVGLMFDFLPVVQPVEAIKAVLMLAFALAGLGMYGTVRDLWGSRLAGLTSAALYIFAPYLHYVDPYARGVVPEMLSLGVWGMALWAFVRLRLAPSPRRWVAAVVGMAAIVLTHNLMAMVFAGVLLGWVVWQFLFVEAGEARPYRLIPAYFLGIGLSAFFWLPVALERNAVNLGTLVGEAGSHFDFRQHFLSVGELFAPSAWLDWGATEPFYLYNLGVAQWVLGGVGVVVLGWQLARGARKAIAQPAFFALMGLLLVGLMLPFSTAVWEAVPLLPFIQFPWRLLGAAASMTAVVGGYAVAQLPTEQAGKPVRAVGACAAIALALWMAVPLTQPAPWPEDFGETAVARIAYIETRGRWLGTTSTADFVPATVDTIPERQGQLLAGLFENETPDRTNYWSVETAGATSRWEAISPLHTRYFVDAPEPFLFRLYQFAFPGWEVRVNGKIVETEVGRPEGFLVIPLEAGEQVVDVQFVDTPPRSWGWAIAGLSLVLMVLGARIQPSSKKIGWQKENLRWPVGVVVVAGVGLVLVSGTAVVRYNSQSVAQLAEQPLGVNFGEQIGLIGASTARHDEQLEVTLYWRAQRPLDINYQAFVHLLAEDGTLMAQADKLNPSDFPTRRWPTDKYVRDHYVVDLPPLAAGEYRTAVGLWVSAEEWRLPVLDAEGQVLGDSFVVEEWRVD